MSVIKMKKIDNCLGLDDSMRILVSELHPQVFITVRNFSIPSNSKPSFLLYGVCLHFTKDDRGAVGRIPSSHFFERWLPSLYLVCAVSFQSTLLPFVLEASDDQAVASRKCSDGADEVASKISFAVSSGRASMATWLDETSLVTSRET
jgi:hypothetical protein